MNLRFLTITILIATSSLARAEVACYEKLLASTGYYEPNEKQKACVLLSEGFTQGISVLCSQDQSNLSNDYIRYLDTIKSTQKAIEEYQSATDKPGRAVAYKNLLSARNETEKESYRVTAAARIRYTDALEACLSK
jgi:hypothetical protein